MYLNALNVWKEVKILTVVTTEAIVKMMIQQLVHPVGVNVDMEL